MRASPGSRRGPGATRASTSRPRLPIGPERSGSATRSISAPTGLLGVRCGSRGSTGCRRAAGVEGHGLHRTRGGGGRRAAHRRGRLRTRSPAGRGAVGRSRRLVAAQLRRRRRTPVAPAPRVDVHRTASEDQAALTRPEARVSGSVRLGDRTSSSTTGRPWSATTGAPSTPSGGSGCTGRCSTVTAATPGSMSLSAASRLVRSRRLGSPTAPSPSMVAPPDRRHREGPRHQGGRDAGGLRVHPARPASPSGAGCRHGARTSWAGCTPTRTARSTTQ